MSELHKLYDSYRDEAIYRKEANVEAITQSELKFKQMTRTSVNCEQGGRIELCHWNTMGSTNGSIAWAYKEILFLWKHEYGRLPNSIL